MEPLQDKILGCWYGMAVGDAMGRAVKGLKPETVKQCFGSMNDFKDVRKFIGKGVKQYRMKGLYGVQTQTALTVCDCVLNKKKVDVSVVAAMFSELAAKGPENYFGVFRHAESTFRQGVNSLAGREPLLPAKLNPAGCRTPSLAIPIALYHQKTSRELILQCMNTCLLMSRHPLEVIASALTGHWVTCFLFMNLENSDEGFTEIQAQEILGEGVEVCRRSEQILKELYPEILDEFGDDVTQALGKTLHGMSERFHFEEDSLFDWICENASGYVKNKITHPNQSHVLTLIPLALLRVLKGGGDFESILTGSLNMGKEATLLGTMTGAWAGAVFGFDQIPGHWRSGLVNGKEIKSRGEALYHRRFTRGLKDALEMETSLTQREMEEGRKYLPKKTQKSTVRISPGADSWDDDKEDPVIPGKDDKAKWRKLQKDKTRTKRDRRRNLQSDFEPE